MGAAACLEDGLEYVPFENTMIEAQDELIPRGVFIDHRAKLL
jgi:hypothetical protein